MFENVRLLTCLTQGLPRQRTRPGTSPEESKSQGGLVIRLVIVVAVHS